MDRISDAAELWLRLLVEEFMCEIANHDIGAKHACKYESGTEARMAMLRLAYLRGREDALAQPTDFDADVARVEAANAKKR
jgi:hypothetical protein